MDKYTQDFWNRMGKLEEQLMRGEDPFGFTDEQARKMIEQHNARVSNKDAIVGTQAGIIKYMEAMAQVMAEAAIASQKAIGDWPDYAIDQWTKVVRRRANDIVREKQDAAKRIEKGATIESEK
jgi:hypothetical protein